MAKRPASTGISTTAARSGTRSRPIATVVTAAARPMASTASAALRVATMSTAAAIVATAPTTRGRASFVVTRTREASAAQWRASNTTTTTAIAASHAAAICAANTPPAMRSRCRTSRFVRFEPGSKRDAVLAMKRHPRRKGPSGSDRRRALSTSTGVRNATAASRFSTAVTIATSASCAASSTRPSPGSRSVRPAARSNSPFVVVRDPADQQQTGDQDERRPRPRGSVQRSVRRGGRRDQQRSRPDAGDDRRQSHPIDGIDRHHVGRRYAELVDSGAVAGERQRRG